MTTATADLSVEQQVAALPPDQRELVLAGLDLSTLAYDWQWCARPSQVIPVDAPEDDFSVAALIAGRGAGKSRSSGEWIRAIDANWHKLKRDDGHMRGALLGRTAADVRDTMLEGPSGLLNIYPPSQRDQVHWIPSRRRVELPGGSVLLTFSAEEPDQLRGPQFHVGACDELASFKQVRGQGELSAWDNLRIAVRLGTTPQILVTTTPRRVPAVRKLLADAVTDPKILLRRGKTRDNVHLSSAYLEVVLGLYEGTTLGKQELDGEMLSDVQGAMVSQDVIDAYRVTDLPIGYPWIKIIGVDPSVAEKPGDECGIVVIYVTRTYPVLKRHAYVMEDLSGRMSPANWGDVVVQAAHEHGATVVAEINQGAGLVRANVNQAAMYAGVTPPQYRSVWSSKAKAVRAEPVGAAYEQGRIHNVGMFPELEDVCTSWVAGEAGYSPDRMDALVHACAAGMFPAALQGGTPGSSSIHSVVGQKMDIRHQAAMPRRQAARELGRSGGV